MTRLHGFNKDNAEPCSTWSTNFGTKMLGEMNLAVLCETMAPTLHPGTFVYCCVPHEKFPLPIEPLCTFKESEGVTVILESEAASAMGLEYQYECAMIALTVHSALNAVGFIAVISNELARQNIPCNVVSAFHHDHLFVPHSQRDHAMDVLWAIASKK
ncbi:ACT domain-containing protein [uncultured Azohydromonas sp.]|uniref:ACT domain-containing protein n=1 Tax=uncultured Azohydromonas sp. TaxID=487342 RepID=UPI0026280A61|nr:ACT domain-containing protein [uncultured Azohydromonas sp.]